jgi:hypothetical protein
MEEKKTSLDDLADATDALRTAGWPPVALFAFDAAWRLVDRLFPVAAAALDVDVKDVLLEPTVFAWALSVAEEDEEKSYSKHAETMKIAASVRPELRAAARGASLRDVLVNGAEKKKKNKRRYKLCRRRRLLEAAPRLLREGGVEQRTVVEKHDRLSRQTELGVRLGAPHGRDAGHRVSARRAADRRPAVRRPGPPGPPKAGADGG